VNDELKPSLPIVHQLVTAMTPRRNAGLLAWTREVDVMQRFAPQPYTERVVAVPPHAVESALDLCLLGIGSRGSRAGDGTRIETEPGSLILDGPGCMPWPMHPSATWPIRHLTGRVRTGRRRFRVELELFPWSRAACVLGLRPAGRRFRRRSDRYYATAARALTLLGGEIERWAAIRRDAQRGATAIGSGRPSRTHAGPVRSR
jgi:hypothetical protein